MIETDTQRVRGPGSRREMADMLVECGGGLAGNATCRPGKVLGVRAMVETTWAPGC